MNFQDKFIEKEFQSLKNEKLEYFIRPVMIFYMLINLSIIIFFSFYSAEINSKPFLLLFGISLVIMCFLFLFLFLVKYIKKKLRLYNWVYYYIYITQIFFFISFRFAIIRIADQNNFSNFYEYLFEIFTRLIWCILFFQSFLENLILNSFSLLISWSIIYLLDSRHFIKEEIKFTTKYTFEILFVITFSWILELLQRSLFYKFCKSEIKKKKLVEVIEEINKGYLSITGGKIDFINQNFITQIKKLGMTSRSLNIKLESKFQNFLYFFKYNIFLAIEKGNFNQFFENKSDNSILDLMDISAILICILKNIKENTKSKKIKNIKL
jgi:hypothetical protein